ncbi:MAG: DUF4923 family protein [Prevotella sp.]|nr:DUF4923 family protein [Prevotella sp.]
MKKISLLAASAVFVLSGCMVGNTGTGNNAGNILGSILGAATNANTIGNILYDVIGYNKLSQADLIGNWQYYQPGCAFTSENLLAKAGGHVAATKAKEDLTPTYQKLGITSANTYFQFAENGQFAGKIDGQPLSGTYTFNTSDQSIQLKTLLLTIKGYVNRNPQGISLLFESKKLLSVLQTISAVSGNSTLSSVGELTKNYDGIRLGLDLTH